MSAHQNNHLDFKDTSCRSLAKGCICFCIFVFLGVFNRFAICRAYRDEPMHGYQLLLFMDGIHMLDRYKGTLLAKTMKDGNDRFDKCSNVRIFYQIYSH